MKSFKLFLEAVAAITRDSMHGIRIPEVYVQDLLKKASTVLDRRYKDISRLTDVVKTGGEGEGGGGGLAPIEDPKIDTTAKKVITKKGQGSSDGDSAKQNIEIEQIDVKPNGDGTFTDQNGNILDADDIRDAMNRGANVTGIDKLKKPDKGNKVDTYNPADKQEKASGEFGGDNPGGEGGEGGEGEPVGSGSAGKGARTDWSDLVGRDPSNQQARPNLGGSQDDDGSGSGGEVTITVDQAKDILGVSQEDMQEAMRKFNKDAVDAVKSQQEKQQKRAGVDSKDLHRTPEAQSKIVEDEDITEEFWQRVQKSSAERSRGGYSSGGTGGEMGVLANAGHNLATSIGWREVLRNIFTQPSDVVYDWRRPSKRSMAARAYMPRSIVRSDDPEHIVIAVDVSGSIYHVYPRFISEIINLFKEVENMTANVLFYDTTVTGDYDLDPTNFNKLLSVKPRSGGTDTNCVPAYVEDRMSDKRIRHIIILTDGGEGKLDLPKNINGEDVTYIFFLVPNGNKETVEDCGEVHIVTDAGKESSYS